MPYHYVLPTPLPDVTYSVYDEQNTNLYVLSFLRAYIFHNYSIRFAIGTYTEQLCTLYVLAPSYIPVFFSEPGETNLHVFIVSYTTIAVAGADL